MAFSIKTHPQTGAELLLIERPFAEEPGRAHIWIDDEGAEYPATREELEQLGLVGDSSV